MNYKKTYRGKSGFTPLCTAGECSFQKLEFGILELGRNESCRFQTGEREAAFVILNGKADFRCDDRIFHDVGQRRTVFEGKAHCLYAPRRASIEVTTPWSVKIAVCMTPIDHDTVARHILPADVRTKLLGQKTFERETHFIVGPDMGASELFVGEAFITPGNWAGFPPHKHDVSNMPMEDIQEELYYYQFQPKQGFGIQCLYTADGTEDVACRVKSDDLMEFPKGYHPMVSAPGYQSYFLWVTSAANPGMYRASDPDHEWIHALENVLAKNG
jgi:5-deoxy-glucuronate isomerase